MSPSVRYKYLWADRKSDARKWGADCIDTRTYTPVPKRVMDGSEDVESLPAAVLSGAPMELQARAVRYVCSLSLHSDPEQPAS